MEARAEQGAASRGEAPRSLLALAATPLALVLVVSGIYPRPASSWLVAGSTALLVVVAAVKEQLHARVARRWCRLATFIGLATFGAALGPRVLGWPTLFPVASSVDAAHHGAMVTWIARNGRLPSRVVPELRQFSEYFLLPHRLVALFCELTGMSPMRALGISGLMAFAGVLVSMASLASRFTGLVMGTRLGAAAAFLVFPCALIISHFTVGALVESYFFGQVVALAFGTIACLGIASNERSIFIVLAGAASIAAYPLQGPLVPGVLVVLLLATRDRRHLRPLVGVLALGGLAFSLQYPYLGASRAMSTDEGSIIALSLSTGGGVFFGALVVAGLVVVLRSIRPRQDRPETVVGIVIVSGFVLTVLQYVAFRIGASLDIVSNYAAGKIVFMIAPFAVCLASIGAVATMATILRRSSLVLAATGLCGALTIAAPTPLQVSTEPPMNRNAYALARWAEDRDLFVPNEEVGVVGPGLTPYFVRWTALGRPIDAIQYKAFDDRLPWRSWPAGATARYLIVAGRDEGAAYRSRAGVREIARRGDAVLLKRVQT